MQTKGEAGAGRSVSPESPFPPMAQRFVGKKSGKEEREKKVEREGALVSFGVSSQ